ncbi:sugar phosphate isomerase/epimerase [Pseudarthrobacter sp. Fe7]|nr:sugar phosphate isomerase/epimerase [Pseudarthrobacter sp. Fe7]
MKLGYCSITWGGVVGHPQGVTSVKDLYYMTHGSMQQAVQDIASVGYQGVEMFDGNLAEYAEKPEELKETLSAAGVELTSVYTGANFIYADILPDEPAPDPPCRRIGCHLWSRTARGRRRSTPRRRNHRRGLSPPR